VKRPLLLTFIAGIAMFLVVLVLYLPAAWFSAALPAQVRCGDLGGSIWHGECLGLTFQGSPLGDARWNFAAGSALTGRLKGDVVVQGNALNLSADLDSDFHGAGELRDVKAHLALDPALLPQLPRDQRGNLTLELKRLAVVAGPTPKLIEGFGELRDLRQVGGQPMELGSYRVDFDGASAADGTVRGKLRDLGGAYAVQGTVTLSPPNAYLVEGFITGRTADAEKQVRQITLGATPDTSGRSPFSFEGTY